MNINKKNKQMWFMFFIFLMLSAILLTGCRKEQDIVPPTATTEITIPFETIEKTDDPITGEYYMGSEPKLFVIMKKEELDALENTISVTAQERLRGLNYDQEIAIVVFQSENIDWLGIEIQRIIQKSNLVTIETIIIERNPQIEFLDMELSPYHVVTIPKAGFEQNTEFELVISYIPQQLP